MASATRTRVSIDDTAPTTVAGNHPTPAPPPSEGRGLHAGWIVGGVLVTILAAAFLAVFLLRADQVGIDEYILAPGSATDTADSIVVTGAETFDPDLVVAMMAGAP